MFIYRIYYNQNYYCRVKNSINPGSTFSIPSGMSAFEVMPANLLITLVKSRAKRNRAFSSLVLIIRQQLMNYINRYGFSEDPEAVGGKL
jgi:hypothetical protein